MNVLFVANIELNENEGIYKKVLAQATGLKNANGNGWLITKKNGGCLLRNLQEDKATQLKTSVLKETRKIIEEQRIRIVYVRHMIPSPELIVLLKWMKNYGIKIFYEIPTYPYYAEQFRTSNKKYRAIVKLGLDTMFWPFIYKYIDKLVVIKSNTNVHMYKKMVEITNGVRVDNIAEKRYDDRPVNRVSMVTVGTLYPYHGYDRVLKGLQIYNSTNPEIPVEFHVVGSSPTIESLRVDAKKMGLCNVIFHGVKTTEELNGMYNSFDIGLGSVALHRRNADIDTTLKVIEYYCRGVVVATSGKSPMDIYNEKVTIHVSDKEDPLDISAIVKEYLSIELDEKRKIAKEAKKVFSWDNIMAKLCR